MPGLGLDLVELADVAGSLDRFGDAFRRRVFTPAELAARPPGPRAEARYLSGLVAVKEAVMKVLGPGAPTTGWHDVEVRGGPAGPWSVQLSGPAAAAAAQRGLGVLSVSICFSGSQALAFALGS